MPLLNRQTISPGIGLLFALGVWAGTGSQAPAQTSPTAEPTRIESAASNPPESTPDNPQAAPDAQELHDQLAQGDSAQQQAILSDLLNRPERITHRLRVAISPLLVSADHALRQKAIATLVADPDPAGFQPLREILIDPNQPTQHRLDILQLLCGDTRRNVIGTLVELTRSESNPRLRRAVFAALEETAGRGFQNDAQQVQQWWINARQLPPAKWLGLQIERLSRQNQSARQRANETERRLIEALKSAYRSADATQREILLNSYLADSLPPVQQLALQLVQTELTDGQTIAPQTRSLVRELTSSSDARTRRLAVQAIAGIRDETDAVRFLAMLDHEPDQGVNIAIVNALGFLGNGSAVDKLTELAGSNSGQFRLEALTALGRLSERDKVSEPQQAALIELLGTCDTAAQVTNDWKLRERSLWAMSRIAAQEFRTAFALALAADQPLEVRQAALYGLRTANDPSLAPKLVEALGEPDAALRRQITELLAQWVTVANVDVLFGRLEPVNEPEPEIRTLAWNGITRLARSQNVDLLQDWIARLPDSDPQKSEHRHALLVTRIERLKQDQAEPTLRAAALAELATSHESLGRSREALLTRLERLQCCLTEPEQRDLEFANLVFAALLGSLYDETLVQQFLTIDPAPQGSVVWPRLRELIEPQLQPDTINQAAAWIETLRAQPPLPIDEVGNTALNELSNQVTTILAAKQSAEITAALDAFLANPDDSAARERLLAGGEPAVTAVRERLAVVLGAEEAQLGVEAALTDLLRELQPDWPGFVAESSREARRRALIGQAQ
jgi:HEAT repeat protein